MYEAKAPLTNQPPFRDSAYLKWTLQTGIKENIATEKVSVVWGFWLKFEKNALKREEDLGSFSSKGRKT